MAAVGILRTNITYPWKISHISDYLDPRVDEDTDVMTHCFMRLRGNTKITWDLVLTFNKSTSKHGEWISLSVGMKEKFIHVRFVFKIWMVTVNGVEIRMNHDETTTIDSPDAAYEIPDFINKDGLFVNYDDYVPEDVLFLKFAFEIELFYLKTKVLKSKRDKIDREDDDENKDPRLRKNADDDKDSRSVLKRVSSNFINYFNWDSINRVSEV